MTKNYNADIAVIKEKLTSIDEKLDGFNRKCETYDNKIGSLEVGQATMKADHSNMAKFQAVLSVILSAIAGYLGVIAH